MNGPLRRFSERRGRWVPDKRAPPLDYSAAVAAGSDMQELYRLDERFAALSGGHHAFLYPVSPHRTVYYVFADHYRTADLTEAEEHVSHLIWRLCSGDRLWFWSPPDDADTADTKG